MAVDHGLRFSVLGSLAVERDGVAVDVGHAKQRAVLALLLIDANRPLTADRIVDALWGERPPRSAAGTLQAYVSNLRRALEPDRAPRASATVLCTTPGGYELRVDPESVDALRFAALVARGAELSDRAPAQARRALVDALELWRGPAFADFRYEDFARAEIERLEDLRATALELRIGADLGLGAGGELIPEIEALVRDHPLRERLRAHQMLALYRAGRQTEALATYRDIRRRLRDELGLDPGQSLRDLQAAILDHDPTLRSAGRPAPGGPAVIRPEPVLVGRDAERRQLEAALERAAAGRGSVVVIEGEAGIGKTRLLEFLQHRAAATGLTTAFARCVEIGGTPPFWPWAQLVRQLGPERVVEAAGDAAGLLAPVLPHAADSHPGPGSPLFRIADGLAAALRTMGAETPVVLVLDDLYSADPDSLSLLTLLGAALDDLPVVVAGSHRGQDLGASHPLTELLGSLVRFDWVERVHLTPFDASGVAALVGGVAGRTVDGDVVEAIRERTNGNALYAIELTKLLCAQNRLDASGAMTAVPGSIRDVVGRRVADLSGDAVRLLRAGAAAGREFALLDLGEVLDLDLDTMADVVGEAVAAGLLRETERPGRYRFSHVIVVDAVLDSLGAIRRAQIHGLLADGLERSATGAPEVWIDIAHHRTEAIPITGLLPAVDALQRAGRHAMASDALGLAEQLFERRRGLVAELPDSPSRAELERDALLDLVRVWTWREGYHSEHIGDATARLWELTGLRRGRPPLDTRVPIVADDPVLSTLQARFSYEMVRGDIAAAQVVVDRYIELATAHPDPMVVLGANVAAIVVAVHAGRVADGVAAAERAADALAVLDPRGTNVVMLPLGQQAAAVTYHAFAGWAYYLAGDRERARTELDAARQWCDRLGHAFTTGFCVAVEGIVAAMDDDPEWVAGTVAWGRAGLDDGQFGLVDVWHELLATWADGMGDGDPSAAADRFRQSLSELGESGAAVVGTLYWAMTATLERSAGRPVLMLAATRRGIDHAARTGERFWYPELERLEAEALRSLGRVEEARSARRRAIAAARDLGIRPVLDRLTAPARG